MVTFKDLTETYKVNKGEWSVQAKVVAFSGDKLNPVLNISRFRNKKSATIFKGRLNFGRMFWKDLFGKSGVVVRAIQEYESKLNVEEQK